MSAARSGSTLVDNSLAQIDSAFTVGEMSFLWRRGVVYNMYCACGRKFRDCEFWSDIYRKIEGDFNTGSAKLFDSTLHNRLKMGFYKNFSNTKETIKIINKLEEYYQEVSRDSKKQIIIDSSKWPTYALLLNKIPSVDLYVIKLVRDPRAVYFSWTKKKKFAPFKDSGDLKRLSLGQFMVEWVVWSSAMEVLKRNFKNRLDIKYEEFAARPKNVTDEILNFIGESNEKNPIMSKKVLLNTNHSVSGNPLRFKRGEIKVQLDDKWKENFSTWRKTLLTFIFLPFLIYYKYSIVTK